MKTHAFLSLFAGALLLAGCDNVPDTMREGLGLDVPVHQRVFSADQKATYQAALAFLPEMGYRYVRGGPAQGELEAISAISIGDSINSSEQFRLKAKFEPAEAGGTEVTVKMTQIIEEDSEHEPARATESPLTDTPLYEVFFRGIQQELTSPRK